MSLNHVTFFISSFLLHLLLLPERSSSSRGGGRGSGSNIFSFPRRARGHAIETSFPRPESDNDDRPVCLDSSPRPARGLAIKCQNCFVPLPSRAAASSMRRLLTVTRLEFSRQCDFLISLPVKNLTEISFQ